MIFEDRINIFILIFEDRINIFISIFEDRINVFILSTHFFLLSAYYPGSDGCTVKIYGIIGGRDGRMERRGVEGREEGIVHK